jgi:DNA-binding NtrC family response regulator
VKDQEAIMTKSANVLVVDDDAVVRLSHQRSLLAARCDVEAAGDGDSALRAMEDRRFDLVLLDLRMPGEDGIAVLKRIKQRWPDSEVMVITGYPTIDTAKEAVRLGACDYLTKPVAPAELIEATTRAISQSKWALRREPAAVTF